MGLWSVLVAAGLMVGGPGGPKALPSPDQVAWQDLGIGVFFHFAPNTFTNKEGDDLTLPLSQFNPEKLDTDQWAQTAVDIGAKYVVLVAKHVGGFCLWPTKTTDYSIASTPWKGGKGDIVKDLAASCHKLGLKFGIYLSPADAKHNIGVGGRAKDPAKQADYDALYRQQLTELLTNYGPIVEIWFDGSQVVDVHDILQKYAPHAMIFQGPQATIRWVGNEDGFAPYPAWNSLASSDAATGTATSLHGDPNGDAWMPVEVDVSLSRPNWFWNTHHAGSVLSLDSLLSIYYRSVGRGANLLINMPPDTSGLIPDLDAARARQFGDEIRRRFGTPLSSVSGHGKMLEIKFEKPTDIDHVELQEDIAQGERVRKHVVEAEVDGMWKEIEQGTQIGERRLVPVTPIQTKSIRLRIENSVGEPQIRRFAAYFTEMKPPEDWAEQAGVWANDSAGAWTQEGAFSLDLTSKLQAAATYRVRFVGEGGQSTKLDGVELIQDGVSEPHLVRPEAGRSDVILLTITALPKTAVLKGVVSGAVKGSVLVQRL